MSESMTDIIKIPMVNLRFSTTASSKRVSQDDSNNDRQPEMAAETGNAYISGTVIDSTDIPRAKSAFSTMTNSI